MAEMLRVHRAEMGGSAGGSVMVLDSHLIWLQPHRQGPRARTGQWTVLEQALVDLHARYERACVED